jgi:glycosyltransferase involved in cell wall biosynthesis
MQSASAGAPPTVSFVVPCYKLAHLLTECIDSILGQTYADFEILILDDCSPDNTAEVARSFPDKRVQLHRNETNLGHLRNYNKGIALARGEYIWLISADDFLCRRDVLEDYMRVMASNPHVGYACAAGFELTEDGVARTAAYATLAPQDRIFDGKKLLIELMRGNAVLASSGLVRKICYERLGAFPFDLPYAGDWYLWCLFALHYDVAYFARESVTYRIHGSSMTESLLGRDVRVCVADDLKVLWRIKKCIEQAASDGLVEDCRRGLGSYYARYLVSQSYRTALFHFTDEELLKSIREFAADASETRAVLFYAHATAGDLAFRNGGANEARKYTFLALRRRPWLWRLWIKAALLALGKAGKRLRQLSSVILHGKAGAGTLTRDRV